MQFHVNAQTTEKLFLRLYGVAKKAVITFFSSESERNREGERK